MLPNPIWYTSGERKLSETDTDDESREIDYGSESYYSTEQDTDFGLDQADDVIIPETKIKGRFVLSRIEKKCTRRQNTYKPYENSKSRYLRDDTETIRIRYQYPKQSPSYKPVDYNVSVYSRGDSLDATITNENINEYHTAPVTIHKKGMCVLRISNSHNEIKPKLEEDCCICLQSTCKSINYFCSTTCGTIVHQTCLLQYKSTVCPVCRTETEFKKTPVQRTYTVG
jgi:hypothetical protein